MKRLWLILCAATLMLSSCVVGPNSSVPNPTPIPDPSLYADVIIEYASVRRRHELFEYPGGRIVTVISMAELAMDSWLLGWAMEAASKDLIELADEASPDDEGFLLIVWMYANGFAASALRCAEERHELGELIETFAAKVGEKRPDTTHRRMVVANTLWKKLPEGKANCSTYLADLPAEEFVAIVVDNESQFVMGPLPAGMSRESVAGFVQEDTGIPDYGLYDHYSYENVAVISPNLVKADEWLHSWAEEAVKRDSVESHSGWAVDWLERVEWMYANGFVASELRCAEGREELADLIEAYAAIIRSERSRDIDHYRMSVVHTLWQMLPEGDVDCTVYLSDLAIEDYMPLMVGNEVYYAFGW